MVIHQDNEARCPAFLKTRKDARVVRLVDEVLWIAPAGAEAPVVVLSREDWARVHASCPGLAAFEALPRARRRDLLAAWLADAPVGARVADGAALVALVRDKLVAADGMDASAAVAAIASLVAWVEQAPEGFVTGRVAAPGGADVRTLYLDTRPTTDWPALARISHPTSAARGQDTSGGEVSRQSPAGSEHALLREDTSMVEVFSQHPAGPEHTRVRKDTLGGEVSPSPGTPGHGEPQWAFAFAPGLALEAWVLSAEEIEAWTAERERLGPAPRNERQLTFSFFAAPLCATK